MSGLRPVADLYQTLRRIDGRGYKAYRDIEGSWRFAEFDDPYVDAGAEFQFYNSPTRDDRAQIWFRPHQWPAEVPDDDFPLF